MAEGCPHQHNCLEVGDKDQQEEVMLDGAKWKWWRRWRWSFGGDGAAGNQSGGGGGSGYANTGEVDVLRTSSGAGMVMHISKYNYTQIY